MTYLAGVKKLFLRLRCAIYPFSIYQKGLESTKVKDVLMIKDGANVGPWISCHTTDSVHEAVKKVRSYTLNIFIQVGLT